MHRRTDITYAPKFYCSEGRGMWTQTTQGHLVESKPTLVAKQTQQRNQRHHQFTYFKCMYKKILTSPTYFCTNSEPITRMKQASVLFATARAQRVFPVPGGPKRRTPFGGSIPRLTNFSGYKQYHQTWVNYCFWAKSLPIRPRKISLQK